MKHFLLLVMIAFATQTFGQKSYGVASYYHQKFEGRLTANGETFRHSGMTCAHNTLPLGTHIKVTNLSNNRSVVVKVNDRLNKNNHRIVDLTYTAAKALGMLQSGITKVSVEIVGSKKSNFNKYQRPRNKE